MSHSKEKRERLLLLICGHATEALQSLMEYFLTNQNKTLQQFIDDNQHDIYHLYRNDRCCMCPAINQTKSKHNRKPPLQKDQIEKLFDTISSAPRNPKHKSRNSTDVCCCFAKSIIVGDLDITFLKCFFINLCQDFLWDKFLLIHHSSSFQQFLKDKQHDIFHLCHKRFVCCKCSNGKFKIPYSNLQISDFMKLYDFKKQNCSMIDTCAYLAKPSLVHYNDFKGLEPKVFMELTNCLCPLRLSIDEIGKIRNKLVHGTNKMQEDYDVLWKKLKSCLLEIGTITHSEYLTAVCLDELWSKPLDMNIMKNFDQKFEKIVENQDVASKILHAKVENLCTTVADMKNDINPRLQSMEDGYKEIKEIIHLNEIFLNQMPLIREMTIFQRQPLAYTRPCSYPIVPQRSIEGQVSYDNEDAIQQQLLANCQAMGLRFTDLITPRNGNCFFEAVSCQLKQNGLKQISARQLRRQVVDYWEQHRSFQAQGGMVFLDNFLMDPFDKWARKMKTDGQFVDHVVIEGTAKMLEHDIFIVSSSPLTNNDNCINYIRGKEDFNRVPILLGHFWEVHYQSLESINTLKEPNGNEENNNAVCAPFISDGPHDILCEIDVETGNILDAAKTIIDDQNLNDYKVTGAKIELTLERRNVHHRQIQLKENGKNGTPEIRTFDHQNNNECAFLFIWKRLPGKLKYLMIFYWMTDEDTSDSEDESDDDEFACKWCRMEFNQLDLFRSHQKTCRSKKSKKKKRNVTGSGDERGKPEQKTAKLVIKKTPAMPKMWKDIVKKMQKKEKDSLDIDGMTVELIKDGSLVVWAKLDKPVVKNGTLFVDTMDKFMINLFKKCPIETEKETSISIQVDVIDSTEDDDEEETDTYKCGRCKEIHTSLASFTAHKRNCVRSRQKAHKIKTPIWKEMERLEKECHPELKESHTDKHHVERQKLSESNSALPLPNKTYTVKQIKRQIESTSVSCRSSGTSGYDTESGADTEIDLIRQNQNFYNKKPYRDVSSGVSSYSDTDESTSYVKRQHEHLHTETKQVQKQVYRSTNLQARSETSGYESGTEKDSEVEQVREDSHTYTRESHGYLTTSYTKEQNKFPIQSKFPIKSIKRNAKNRRKKRRASARSSTSETNLEEENDIAINFEWGNDDDYYPYIDLDNESDDVYSDENNSDDMQMQSDSDDEENVEANFDRVKINYYEMSRAFGKDERLRTKIDTKMIQYGLALSTKCLANMQQKFRKSSKKYESYYTPFIKDVQSLISMCENNPDRYKRGILKIRSSHNASCTLLESTGGNESVEISGRSKCGMAYSDDDIVVEIHQPTGHTSYIQRMDRRIKVAEQVFGKVIGRIKQNRYEGIAHPVLVCELDKHEYDKAKPVCRTLPKFHLLSENRDDKNPFSVDIYNYDESARKITFKRSIQLSPTMRKKFLFYVAFISWTGLYPLGAIIKVHESTKDFLTGLDILELQYKVPTLYTTETVKCVERLIDDNFRQNKLGRFDLTDPSKIKIFTIDPKNARVLDDAVSIEKLPNGEFRVGVHISDVSCFIKSGSEVDQEARDRGTTFFRGNFGDPHQMLPEPISTDRCSLTAGKSRLALSVFYHFDKHLHCIHKNTACIKSIIRSCNQLSYDEVQRVIEDNLESSLKEEIQTLFQISKSLRKKRLGNGMFSVSCENELFETDDTLATCPEAYYLIEELMILTNYSVASYLLRKFPECVPLRCQDPPSAPKLKEWRKAYPVMADIILCLQGYPKCMDMKTIIKLGNLETKEGDSKLRPNDITFIQKWLWKSVANRLQQASLKEEGNDYGGAELDEKVAALLLRKEELHPFHALAIHEWKSMQGFAEYRCSGIHKNEDMRKLRHFNLGIFPYTHFTAPIRRYIDLEVHRLLHAAIDGEPVDSIRKWFDCEKMHSLCQNVNKAMIRAKDYARQCRSLLLAFKLRSSPVVVNSFVEECSDKDISLVIPGCNFLPKQCRSLRVNLLGVSERPKFYDDLEKLNSPAKRKFMVLTWKDRIYSKFGNRPFPKYPNRGYQVAKKGNPQKIDPNQKSDITQTSTWINYIKQYVLSERGQLQMQFASNFERGEALSGSFLHSSLNTENDVNSEINCHQVQNENDNRIITEQFCNYSMDFHHGQVIAVQLSSEMQRGILTPYIQLMDLTRNLKYCLQHMRDPIGCLEKYSTVSSIHYYDNSEHYKNVWIPILLMETAMKVVRDNNVIINDLPVIFQATGGFFTLKSDFCYERNIDVTPMPFSLKSEDDKQFDSVSSDYLCIKWPVSVADGRFLRINKSTPPHEYKILTNHAKIEKVSKANKNTADEKLKIHFRILGPKTVLLEDRPVCTIEIMQKPEIDKRVEVELHQLNKATKLAKAIALKRSVPNLDEDRKDSISEYDVDIGLPNNNKEQNKAIKMSLEETFSLIHGPPGTGKTNMGIKLVCLFNAINRKMESEGEERKQMVYCGPSNKSVDLVAARLLQLTRSRDDMPKIGRLYGSSIENLDYPIPGREYSTKKNIRDSNSDSRLASVSVHHLIRRVGQKFAAEINSRYRELRQMSLYIFESQSIPAHSQNKFELKKNTNMDEEENGNAVLEDIHEEMNHNDVINKVKAYNQLVQEATIEELKSFDVVFCTTAMATNSKLLKGMENKIFQVIIDECGMCTEPECISTIIATKAEQVVLIGDHKQLQPVVVCPQARQLGLQTSLFERYHNAGNVVQLTTQYRMHRSICEFPSKKFYNDKLKTDENSKSYVEERPLQAWFSEEKRTVFCHVEGEEEILPVSTEEGNEMSRRNQKEVDQVIKIYRYLHNEERIFERKRKQAELTINVMSQYNDQCAAIRAALKDAGFEGVNVNTVVSSQGGEWDYIIFSLVRSLPDFRIEKCPTLGWCSQNLGFITDKHQINVALTRAKKGLFLIGNKHLLKCDEVWKDLIHTYDRKGCVVNGSMYPSTFRQRKPKKKKVKRKPEDVDEDGFKKV